MWRHIEFDRPSVGPRITVTVPHAACEDEMENRCDRRASQTWRLFCERVGASRAFVGAQVRRARDLNRGSVSPAVLQGADFVVDYHSSHVAPAWYALITPQQEALVGRHARAVFGAERCRAGSAANAVAEAAAERGIPCVLVEVTAADDVEEVARAVRQLVARALPPVHIVV